MISMSNEEKILDLEKRLAALEKVEKRRKLMNRISLGFKLVITIALAVVCYKIYLTLSEYKEKLDQIQNIQDKLSVSSDLLEEQLNKFNIFK